MKIKTIDKKWWTRVIKGSSAWTELDEREGVAYLIRIDEVTAPLVKPCFGQDLVLADNGYYWLQIGLKGENFWITAMYDENERLVEYYFDVTRKNYIDGENSKFEDLYLDVNVGRNGEIELLDEDELEVALKTNDVTEEDYILAQRVAREIMENVLKNRDKCDKICLRYFNILKKKLAGE